MIITTPDGTVELGEWVIYEDIYYMRMDSEQDNMVGFLIKGGPRFFGSNVHFMIDKWSSWNDSFGLVGLDFELKKVKLDTFLRLFE